jgi:hypothetical protein
MISTNFRKKREKQDRLSGAGMQSILWTTLMSQTSAIGRIECKKMTIKRKYAAPDDNSQGIFSQRPLALEAEGRADRERPKETFPTNVVNLMDALRRSVAQERRAPALAKKGRKRRRGPDRNGACGQFLSNPTEARCRNKITTRMASNSAANESSVTTSAKRLSNAAMLAGKRWRRLPSLMASIFR